MVNREFDNREYLEVVVSDLTYVNVSGKCDRIKTVQISADNPNARMLYLIPRYEIPCNLKKLLETHTAMDGDFCEAPVSTIQKHHPNYAELSGDQKLHAMELN